MSKPKPSAPVVTLQRSEFSHLVRGLEGIRSRVLNLLCVAEALDIRANSEFAESLRIIRTGRKGGGRDD